MTSKHLNYHDHTDSILLGYQIGSGEIKGRTLTVTGSGDTVRFAIEGIDGYVDLPLGNFAALAAEWLLELQLNRDLDAAELRAGTQ
jgi:hypothetical protein